MNNYKKFIKLLKEIFQTNKSELDFGIYKIMNQRRKEVNLFIDKDLKNIVEDQIGTYTQEKSKGELEQKLADRIDFYKEQGLDLNTIENLKEIRDLKEKVELSVGSSTDISDEIYSHLSNFFGRYYKEGDFISQRRYKGNTYAIPYDGEEVKLHWANHDQYYIKTTEQFNNYQFNIDDYSIRFKVVRTENERDNNKGEDKYWILTDKPLNIRGKEIVINFEYRHLSKNEQEKLLGKYNELQNKSSQRKTFGIKIIQEVIPNIIIEQIEDNSLRKTLQQESSNKEETILKHHFIEYTSKNKFDYFIHKNLETFLKREFDFYIKNEVLFIDDIEEMSDVQLKASRDKVRAVRKIAYTIIDFLAQIENFQKGIFEKKKFVVENEYCITLDHIDEKFYRDIVKNQEQINEWKSLKFIDEKTTINVNYLKKNPYLILDTKFFPDIKWDILANIENLDDKTNGILINSENWQALNLLKEKFKEKIKCVYIDPPYNTGNDGFLYKDTLKSSSWLSMMEDRLLILKSLCSNDGVFFASIDDNEIGSLTNLLSNHFPRGQFITNISVLINPRGRTLDKFIAKTHEYITTFSLHSHEDSILEMEKTGEKLKDYKYKDENGKYRILGLRNRNPVFTKENRPNLFYPLYVNPNTNMISIEETKDYCIRIIPQNSKGEDDCWTWGKDKVRNNTDKLLAKEGSNGWRIFRKDYLNKDGSRATTKVKSIWKEKFVNNEYGKEKLGNLFDQSLFSFPKSHFLLQKVVKIGATKTSYILDYFAGSGTTGHAVIDLNREDDGDRKYILVEMGEYFDTVLKPRIQKVIFAKEWKDGRPIKQDSKAKDQKQLIVKNNPYKGVSHIFKYQLLESYEDTLNNLELIRGDGVQRKFEESEELRKDYVINYMLENESKKSLLNVESFESPFDYELNITKGGVITKKKVDLPETFNYLMGIYVEKVEKKDGYYLYLGHLRDEEAKVLVLWRDINKVGNTQLNKIVEELNIDFDQIYVNGDNTLNTEKYAVRLIESEFINLMF